MVYKVCGCVSQGQDAADDKDTHTKNPTCSFCCDPSDNRQEEDSKDKYLCI